MALRSAIFMALSLSALGCRGATWQAGPSLLARPRRVAEALGDPLPVEDFDPDATPVPDPPRHIRPCCAFGMDLRVDVTGVPVPFYRVGNLLSVGDVGHHEYDNGVLSLGPPGQGVEVERSGLAYTCRGGWIDIAHVRDYADLTLFIALRLTHDLDRVAAFEVPGDGAARRITVAAIPAELLERHGRFNVAITLAEWIAFQLSIWHEVASWWGWESTPGFSERLSTFSPEDLYSNALGIRISAGVMRDQGFRSRDEYDRQMGAWIPEALRRLQAQPADVERAVMHSLDGLWWDSRRRVPDVHLVLRRSFPTAHVITPWRAQDAYDEGSAPEELRARCPLTAAALPLRVADRVGDIVASDLVRIEWRPERWAGASFPFPNPGDRVVRSPDLPAVVAATRADMERVLGAGFDRPRGPIARDHARSDARQVCQNATRTVL